MELLTKKEQIALERLIRDYECNCEENTIEVKILKRLLARSGKQTVITWKTNLPDFASVTDRFVDLVISHHTQKGTLDQLVESL